MKIILQKAILKHACYSFLVIISYRAVSLNVDYNPAPLPLPLYIIIAGIAGVFTIFSSFVFSIVVINLVGSDLTGLK